MQPFLDLLPDLLKTRRCQVQTLASVTDGWFVHFRLYDDDHDCWIEGHRVMHDRARFVDAIDLLCELWCTPNLCEV